MFQIKICGITRKTDATAAGELGAEAIGLNFYEKSPRYVTLAQAESIVSSLKTSSGECTVVGVFVNDELDNVHLTAERLRLSWVQLHGDETPEYLAKVPEDLKVLRAYRMGVEGLEPLGHYIDRCEELGRRPDAILVDAAVPGVFGGSGHQLDWTTLTEFRSQLGDIPLILAGGLTAENVDEAIHTVAPDGVDVASGVESAPGVKDASKMRSFIKASKQALSEIGM